MERILIIEDDAALAGLVRDYLKPFGYEVTAAPTAAEGLRRLPEGWSAVLLDVMLPDLDGFEVCRRIRAGSDVPVLMLTARGRGQGPHRRARARRRRLPAQALQPARAAGAAAARCCVGASPGAAGRRPALRPAGDRPAARAAASTARSARSRATSSTCWWRSRSRRAACWARAADERARGDAARRRSTARSTFTSRASAPRSRTTPGTHAGILTVRGAGYVFARKQDED